MSESLRPHGLYSPWNSPGQNTGVGSLSLLQGIFPTRDWTQVSLSAGGFLTSWATRETQNFSYKQKTEPPLVSFPARSVGVSESPFFASLLTQQPFCLYSCEKRSEGETLAWTPAALPSAWERASTALPLLPSAGQPSDGRLNHHVSCIALCKIRGKKITV